MMAIICAAFIQFVAAGVADGLVAAVLGLARHG
jgi:hypothetical protein